MEFADPQDKATAYLILRHLYDGDVIEWPIADDHPLRHVFAALEAQGYIARWDRMWPRHDRYRLTDQGIAAIEAVYRPAGAEAVYHDLRHRNPSVAQRRAYLVQRGYDPLLWPLLHDPTTHWELWRNDHGRYYDWFWEDQLPYRHRRSAPVQGYVASGVDDDIDDTDDTADQRRQQAGGAYVVDLDREASAGSASNLAEPAAADYDVS
ncbi:MAG: hypothetical protein E6J90_26640 [Deltaproteobacteria bacterium]|nr:MAG: hypothetical protein E6J90_26640 [Deltaproteobacteria bacterium]TMQ15088.1 MAG: hypothetical protein E6J91_13920 [Deltaproteobacteria bacterium]